MKKQDSQSVFHMLDDLARLAQELIIPAQGRLIKLLGDSALIVFPEKNSDAGINIMMELQNKGERLLARYSPLTLSVFCHVGDVTIGPMGPHRQLDIIGKAVNTLFKLEHDYPQQKLVISPQAFRKLRKETRERYHKFTPPVVYFGQ